MMSILGRLIRRNILGKPMRSFAIIIALAASAFAMLFCIAGREAPEHAMRERLLNAYGGSEMLVIDSKGYNLILNESDYPAGTKIYRLTGIESQAKSQKGEYPITVAALDTKAGKQIGIFDEALDPGKGVIISEAFATKSGLKEGDTVTFTRTTQGDDGKDKVRTLSLKVAQVSNDKYLRRKTSAVIVNMDNFKALTGITGTGYKTAMVDLPDDEDVKKLASDLTKKYSDKEYIFNPVLTDDLMDEISKQTMVFYLIFAVVLLMTLFLTFSMSRHIANERLSTIGTLRSIGGSIPKTSTLLIIESAVYGLIGGLLGMVGFMLGGEFAVQAFFGPTGGYSMPIWCYPLSAVLAVAIQIICQSSALIKAVRTPVRDIIFSSRDTAYVLNIKKVSVGAFLFAAGTVLSFFVEETFPSIAAISLICVGAVMILPVVIKLVSKLLVKVFAALGMPTAKLAANECSHKKSTVASTQLTFIALAITASVFIVSSAITDTYSTDHYKFDSVIYINKHAKECEFITKLPEVAEYQIHMTSTGDASVNGAKKQYVTFLAYSDFKLNEIVKNVGKEPAEGEAYIGKQYARKLGVKKGDTLTIEEDSVIINKDGTQEKVRYSLTVKDVCDIIPDYRDTLVVNKQWFNKQMGDYVDSIYIRYSKTGNIEKLRAAIENKLPSADIASVEECIQNTEEDCSSIMTIIYSILGVGCVLALLGSVSNAIIGFEQSKRKYAVLHSVAASKKKLSKLILLETLCSSLTAGVMASLLSLLLTTLIGTTLDNSGMLIVIQYNILLILGFILALVAVLMLAAIKPILSLKKMNTAAELKYE